MHVRDPCGIWTVAKNHNIICSDNCNQWVHIIYNNITKYGYKKLQMTNHHGTAGCVLERWYPSQIWSTCS